MAAWAVPKGGLASLSARGAGMRSHALTPAGFSALVCCGRCARSDAGTLPERDWVASREARGERAGLGEGAAADCRCSNGCVKS